MKWEKIHSLVAEMVEEQRCLLLEKGRQVVPYLTAEDLLQPNDFPQLEEDPVFRYEEGILAGFQSVQMALRAFDKLEEEY